MWFILPTRYKSLFVKLAKHRFLLNLHPCIHSDLPVLWRFICTNTRFGVGYQGLYYFFVLFRDSQYWRFLQTFWGIHDVCASFLWLMAFQNQLRASTLVHYDNHHQLVCWPVLLCPCFFGAIPTTTCILPVSAYFSATVYHDHPQRVFIVVGQGDEWEWDGVTLKTFCACKFDGEIWEKE